MISIVSHRIANSSTTKIIAIGLLLSLVSACSQKAVYTQIQRSQRYHCLTLPESEQTPCLDALEISYEEYQKQRQALNENGLTK